MTKKKARKTTKKTATNRRAKSQGGALPYPVGTKVYVRGAIYSVTGKVLGRDADWLHLGDACYIGTDGRFGEATEKGVQNVSGSEIEPVGGPGVIAVNVGAISDVCVHPDPLPRSVK